MAAKNGFYLYGNVISGMKMLTPEQVGQLVLAMAAYVEEGTEPQFDDRLLEVVFVMASDGLDRNNERANAMAAKAKESGKKGGRSKKNAQNAPEATQDPQEPEPSGSEPEQSETFTAPFADETELLQNQQDINEVLDAAQDAGFTTNNTTLHKLTEMVGEHGKDLMLRAIDACNDQGKTSLSYLRKVAENLKNGRTRDKPMTGRDPNDYELLPEL